MAKKVSDEELVLEIRYRLVVAEILTSRSMVY